MAGNGYLFDWNAVQRIANTVATVEGGAGGPFTSSGSDPNDATFVWVKAGPKISTGVHSGSRYSTDVSTGAAVLTGDILVKEINGAELTVGSIYRGTFSHYGTGSKPVFSVQASGGSGGAPLVIDVVTDIACVSGVLTVTKRRLTIPGGSVV